MLNLLPKKYHLARNLKRFNMAEIPIAGETKIPNPDIRILGVQTATKLDPQHIKKNPKRKMVTQTRALRRHQAVVCTIKTYYCTLQL